MANRKEEASGGSGPGDRSPQPTQSTASQGGASQAASPEGGNGGGIPKAAEEASRQATEFRRRSTDLVTQAADRGLRQAAEITRRQTSGATDTYRDIAEHSRVDIDTVLQSSARLAQGLQEMTWEMTQFSQQSLQLGLRLANELMECRSVEGMMSLQREFLKESMEVLASESARVLAMSTKVTNDAVNPLAERIGSQTQTAVSRWSAGAPERAETRDLLGGPHGKEPGGRQIRQ